MALDGRFTEAPVIIGGCGRSGTSLLLAVLSAHPRIYAIPYETRAFCPTAYSPRLDLRASFQLDSIEAALSKPTLSKEVVRWCEKTPKNVLFFERLLEHFGGRVRLINIVRDGRDVITSRHPKDPGRSWVGLDRWIQDVRAGLVFDSHPSVLLVKYEDLVLRFSETAIRIFEFVGESAEEVLASWHERATVRTHPAWANHVQRMHGASIGKWQLPDHQEIVAEMMADKEAIRLLEHYGYVRHNTKPIGAWRPAFAVRRLKRRVPRPVKAAVKELLRHVPTRRT